MRNEERSMKNTEMKENVSSSGSHKCFVSSGADGWYGLKTGETAEQGRNCGLRGCQAQAYILPW